MCRLFAYITRKLQTFQTPRSAHDFHTYKGRRQGAWLACLAGTAFTFALQALAQCVYPLFGHFCFCLICYCCRRVYFYFCSPKSHTFQFKIIRIAFLQFYKCACVSVCVRFVCDFFEHCTQTIYATIIKTMRELSSIKYT